FPLHDTLNEFEIFPRITEGAVDIRDADAALVLVDAIERVADIDHALFDDRKIDSGALADQKSLDHVRPFEADAKLEARQAGLRDFDGGSADAKLVADEGIGFQEALGSEV